ncbi:hypothetical protein WMY93_022976 [Mugilogobius chulae]|uniref:Fibulin C-terminal Ig-like domain-containing protein n=1 Tax=Mugilogobius chulae TaxID=88201 RepID=A0AAW0N313_9GOBI
MRSESGCSLNPKYFLVKVLDHPLCAWSQQSASGKRTASLHKLNRVARLERTDIIRCIKNCLPGDYSCVTDPVTSIAHTFISLATMREFTRPEGVVRQVKPLIGPLSTVLKLLMLLNFSTPGESSQNVINVHVFVSEFWF